jgi:hypothetical protein
MDMIASLTRQVNNGVAFLRRWNGGALTRDLLAD